MVTTQPRMGGDVTPPNNTGKAPAFKLSNELLHGGKGKDEILVNVNCNHNPTGELEVQPCTTVGWEGLNPPRLEETGGAIHGDNKTQMQKENKRRWQRLKEERNKESQWTTHQNTGSDTPAPHPHNTIEYRNSMCPTGRALAHPAAGLLIQWATLGCPTHTGQWWIKEEIWAAVARGPHWSALSPEAINHFTAEAAKKVHTKQARIVAWDDIKDNPPRQLKILPIVAISHKSKAYRSILDLSFRLHLKNRGYRQQLTTLWKKPHQRRQ
jgi:hypothetical protein